MAHFHLVSPAAILLMPVLVLPMTLAMISGFGVLLFGAWLPLATKLCAILCDQNLALLEWVVAKTASWKWSHLWVAGPRSWWLCGIYLILGAIIFIPGISPSEAAQSASPLMPASLFTRFFDGLAPWRRPLALVSAWCTVGLGVRLAAADSQRWTGLHIRFGRPWVRCRYRTSRRKDFDLRRRPARQPLRAHAIFQATFGLRGQTHIDAIVISHNDGDHFNAVPELLRRFSVGVIYVSPVMFNRHACLGR